jgi:hypothetical protein
MWGLFFVVFMSLLCLVSFFSIREVLVARRHATDDNIAKVLELVTTNYSALPNPTGAHLLKPATADAFIALGWSANMAVWQYFQRVHRIGKDDFTQWLEDKFGLKIYELNWVLQELRNEAQQHMPVLPVDRRPYHFVPSDFGYGGPEVMVLYPEGPTWREATVDHMVDSSEYSESISGPHVDTRISKGGPGGRMSIKYDVPLHAATIALKGEFQRLVDAPLAFRQAWCAAAEAVTGGNAAAAYDLDAEPGTYDKDRYNHSATVVLKSIEAYRSATSA